jgi:hypothetical protein
LRNPAVRSLVLGQVAFFALLLVTIRMRPEGLKQSMSYYGTCRETALPYGLAFLLFSLFTLRATYAFPAGKPFRAIAWTLRLITVLIAGAVATPYTASQWNDILHTLISMTAFDAMLILTGWLAFVVRRDPINVALFWTQFFGGALALLSLCRIIHLFLPGEVLFELAFGVVLARTIAQLLDAPPPAPALTQP